MRTSHKGEITPRQPTGSRQLCLDGVYAVQGGRLQFRPVPPPGAAELEALLGHITRRIARHLERRGLLVRDVENSYLPVAPDGDAALDTLSCCLT